MAGWAVGRVLFSVSRRASRPGCRAGQAGFYRPAFLLPDGLTAAGGGRAEEFSLGLEADGRAGGPLPITSSRMGHLLDTLERAYRVLGLEDAAGGDDVFRHQVLARIIEPVSKLDSLRVLRRLASSWPPTGRSHGACPSTRRSGGGSGSPRPARRTPGSARPAWCSILHRKVPSARRGQVPRQVLFLQAKGTFICSRSRSANHWRKLEARA